MAVLNPILIVGGGIGGLALAQGLRKASIPFRIFERETALNIRSQGYRVRINDEGQKALEALLPTTLYSRLLQSLPPNAASVVPVAHLNALTGEAQERPKNGPPGPGPSPHQIVEQLNADRGVLRDVLMHDLEANVQFGKEFKEYEITEDGVLARFSDGTEELGSLLVGADGTRSRVKKQFLPTFRLVDTQVKIIYGKTALNNKLEGSFNAKALNGMTIIQDRSQENVLVLLLEAMCFKDNEYRKNLPEDYIYWALMGREERFIEPATTKEDMLNLSSSQASELAQKLTSQWDQSFHPLFSPESIPQTSLLSVLSSKPDIPFWKPSSRVTLIGDAIHAMSPTAAAGAATAIRDAATLVELLTKQGTQDQAEIIGEYERQMRVYARETIMKSAWGGKLLFSKWDFEEMKEVE